MVATADHLASSAGVADPAGRGQRGRRRRGRRRGPGRHQPAPVRHGRRPVRPRPPRRASRSAALCAAGRAGSGADAVQARAEGLDRLPCTGDIRAVTVPGCVDGWLELHRRFGRLPLDQVLEAADHLRRHRLPRVAACCRPWRPPILELDGVDDYLEPAMAAGGRLPPGTLIRRPGVAAALDAVAAEGRGRLLPRPVRRGAAALGRRPVHPRRPGPAPGRVGRAAARSPCGATTSTIRPRRRRAT